MHLLFLFQSLVRIFRLRKYEGQICFIPGPGYETMGEPLKEDGDINKSNFHVMNQELEASVKGQGCGYQGPSMNFDISDWRTLEGPFVLVWLHNVPWASEDTMPAPEAKVETNFTWLFFFKKNSIVELCI